MKKTAENKFNNKKFFNTFFFILTVFLFVQCGTIPNTQPTVNSNEIRDYICLVNRYIHPNMERYLNTVIREDMDKGDDDSDTHALNLEYEKRGGFGSGFVYVDSKGNNFIITNYHVIVGAYRLSVTFENEDGKKTIIKNLSVLNVDEQEDLAILAFPEGIRPFRRGLPISGTQLRSGGRVAAAGYPGISYVPTWNLYFGNVGNPRVTPPGEEYTFIQHDAAINPGNSGGPLLIEDTRSPVGYSVAGVNTMQIQALQGANYAIPSERVSAFLQRSFQQTVSLEERIRPFMELLERSTTSDYVYESLSTYLSSTMINADPSRAANAVPAGTRRLYEEVRNRPVSGIAWAVAYSQIEMPIFNKSRNALAQRGKPELLFYEENNMGGYTARLLINGYPYRTEWIRESGTWKLDEFIEDAGEYNDYYNLANLHPIGKKVIYTFSSSLDYDWYTLNIPRSGRLTVRTEGNADPCMVLYYDPTVERTKIGEDDDSGQGYNALVSADVRAGTVYVCVSMAAGSPGEYILIAGLDGELDNVPYTAARAGTTAYNGPQVTIVNNTGNRIFYVYISETTSDSWGSDRLASDQILGSGESVSLQLPRPINQVNRYDIRLVDSNSNDYVKWDVQVSANGRIVFTSSDRQ